MDKIASPTTTSVASGSQRLVSAVAALAIVVGVAVFALAAWKLLLKHPPVWCDEPLFVQPAGELLRTGRLGLGQWDGAVPGAAEHVYWMPPLYFLYLCPVVAAGGENIVAARLGSVLLGIVAAASLWAVGRRCGLGRWAAALPPAVIVADMVFVRGCLIVRPDMLAIALILLALLAALAVLDSPSPKAARAALAGLAAGAAPLAHPLGLAATAAVVLWTLAPRRRAVALPLMAGLALPLLAWGLYIAQAPGDFAAQFAAQVARKTAAGPLWTRAAQLVGQYGGGKLGIMAAGMWLAGLAGLVAMARRSGRLGLLPLMQGLLLAGVLVGGEMWYTAYLAPLTALGMTELATLACRGGGLLRRAAAAVAMLAMLAFMAGNIKQLYGRYIETAGLNYTSWAMQVSAALPAGRVLICGEPDPYFILRQRDDLVLSAFVAENYTVDEASYRRFLESQDYLVIGPWVAGPQLREFVDRRCRPVTVVRQSGPRQSYCATIYQRRGSD
jgi:hypothetical protein